MANQDTKLSLSVSTKGVSSAQSEINKLNKTTTEGAKTQLSLSKLLDQAMKQTARSAEGASKAAARAIKESLAAEKAATKAAKTGADILDAALVRINRNAESTVKAVRKATGETERLYNSAGGGDGGGGGGSGGGGRSGGGGGARRAARAARGMAPQHHGAFLQGLLEGAMPGNLSRIVDRGPGALRQAAGIMAGSVGSSLASIPFTGMGGLMGAAGALGSMASAPIERIFGNTGSALGRQHSQLGMLPYLGNYGVQQMAGTGGISGMSDQAMRKLARQNAAGGDISQLGPREQAALLNTINARSTRAAAGFAAGSDRDGFLKLNGADGQGQLPYIRNEETRKALFGPELAKLEAQRRRDRNSEQGFNPLQKLGQRFGGRDISETQSFVTQMAMRAGGQADDLAQQGLIESGLAANTKYGVSPEVAGAFGRAGRNGGLVGGGGNDVGFAKMIGAAVAQGLTGSDLTRATEQMATVLSNFEATGIPLAPASISSAAAGFGKMGFSPAMAQAAGMGVTSTIQGIGMNGPTDAFGIAAIQALHGGESYDAQLSAMREMRNPTAATTGKIYSSLIGRVPNKGRGQRGHRAVMNLLGRLQAPHDDASADAVQAALARGDTTLPASIAAQLTPEGLAAAGSAATPEALRAQAAANDRKANLGEKGVRSSQAADEAADTVAKGVGQVLTPALDGVAKALAMLTTFLEGHMGSGPVAKAKEATDDGTDDGQ